MATTAGALVALGFALVHGIPVASDRTEPYWGDGSADALQWIGVLAIWACCAWVLVLATKLDDVGAESGARAVPAGGARTPL